MTSLVLGILILLFVFGGCCFALIYSYNDNLLEAARFTAYCLGLVILVVTGIGLSTYGMVEVLG